jgi:hypothetical protein
MFSQPIASRMAAESTRRALPESQRLVRPAGPRRAIALVLQSAAYRLDPYMAAAARS